MGEAAYNEAKQNGELIEQRLRALAFAREVGDHYPDELATLREAADLSEWQNRERDSLIAENERLTGQRDRLLDAGRRSLNWLASYPGPTLSCYEEMRAAVESVLKGDPHSG